MKAIVYNRYGSPDVLRLQEVDKPTPKDTDVLVKVQAASLNAADLDYLNGAFLIRLGSPFKPAHKILGSDIVGRVEAIGSSVTRFKVGDDVFGDLSECGFGAFAEYVCVPEKALALKPTTATAEETATLPAAAVIALQSLRDNGQVKPAQKVLVNGAGGGVGTFAVQLARLFGAEVTAVDATAKLDMLRGLGADHVIDYTQEDFTRNGQRYDLILEVVARRSIYDYQRALSANGTYVLIGGSVSSILQAVLVGSWISKQGSQKMGILMARQSHQDLATLKDLIETGKIKAVIDRVYPLAEVADALRYLESGRAKGKVVIHISA